MELTKKEIVILADLVIREANQRHNDYAPDSETLPLFQLGWKLRRNADLQRS